MRQLVIRAAVLILFTWVSGVEAGRASEPTKGGATSPSRRPLAIKAGRMLDVRTGSVATNTFILVEGERIRSIGPTPPSGVEFIDLSGEIVLPGLIDCHAHILGDPKDQSSTA